MAAPRTREANGNGKNPTSRLSRREFRFGLLIFALAAAAAALAGGLAVSGPYAERDLTWAVLGLGVAAWFAAAALARRAHRPLLEARAALDALHEERLAERLFYPEADDEAGRLFAAINALLDRVDKTLEGQRRFVGGITHDLRTPLTIIRGDIEVALMQERSAEAYRGVLASNLEEVERIGKLVEDLLTVSRGRRAELGLKVRGVDLNLLLHETREHYAKPAAERGVALSLHLEEEVEIEGDRDRLRQVLNNLVENALHYTPAGGRVELALFRDETEARILVKDTGVGIETADLPHVFEPFYRGAQREESHQGYGLGLAICRTITEAHGGTVRVESRVGPESGTTFYLRLPLQAREGRTYRVGQPSR